MEKIDKLTPEQNLKAVAIVERICEAMTEEKQLQLTQRDAKLMSLEKEWKAAQDKLQMLKAEIIHRQMACRIKEILNAEALRLLPELTRSGDIIHFMPDEDKEKFNKMRGMVCLLYDVLDTAFNDFTSVIRSCGLIGHCTFITSIEKARKDIEKWNSETVPVMHMPSIKPLVLDEADRIYAHTLKRMDALQKKVDKKYFNEHPNPETL